MEVLASATAPDNSITVAVVGFVGVLIGALVAGGVSLWVAKQTREAAERAWIRDNRREIYDRFLTCAQRLLITCEAVWKSDTPDAKAAAKAAHAKFFEAYGVVQTVAEKELVDSARNYAYRLLELTKILDFTSAMGREEFGPVEALVRKSRHETIDKMRKELGLVGSACPKEGYNPFDKTPLADKYTNGGQGQPESAVP